jgi:general secretion pathway protein B
LLGANILFLAVILLRPDSPQPDVTVETSRPEQSKNTAVVSPTSVAPVRPTRQNDERPPVTTSFEQQVAAAKENRVAPEQMAESPAPVSTSSITSPAAAKNYMMTFDEARVQGLFQLVDLHVDIHVFGDTAADRFVFINMKKHREGSQLSEGPTVREITVDGVILEYQGTVFLLPRD